MVKMWSVCLCVCVCVCNDLYFLQCEVSVMTGNNDSFCSSKEHIYNVVNNYADLEKWQL